MRKIALPLVLAACLLLSGCASLLDRQYSTVEAHTNKYWESEADDTLRAETYQDIVNDLLILIGRHTEDAALRLYNYEDDATVTDALEKAASEVQQETPMGSYAAEYITSTSTSQRGYYEISIHISYRRTAEQIQAVVNATSTTALPDLLNAALDAGKTELTVRIGYWGNGEDTVNQIVADVRQQRSLTETPPWTVEYYPKNGDVGLIEFLLAGQQPSDSAPADSSADGSSSGAASSGVSSAAGSGPSQNPQKES